MRIVFRKKSNGKASSRRGARAWGIGARLIVWLGLPIVFFLACYLIYLHSVIHEHFEGRKWDLPSRIYSDTFLIYPGAALDKQGFYDRLKRLAYVPVKNTPREPGEYFRDSERLEIYLHAFDDPSGRVKERLRRFDLDGDTVKRIVDPDGRQEIFTERLEPEVIAEFFGKAREERHLVSLNEVPLSLRQAVVATEDRRFYEHHGVDPKAILRAMVANLKAGGVTQGGSTLTQQLIKNFILSSERSYTRKANEIVMALVVEASYSKDQILECYLNEVYFGQRGSVAIHGVGEAANFYFGKPVQRLSLGESALLAAIIKGPGLYSPFRHLDRAVGRQKLVLKNMVEAGFISESQMREAVKTPLSIKKAYSPGADASYFVDLARRQLTTSYDEDRLTWDGLQIFTTIDVGIQQIVSKELAEGLSRLEKQYAGLRHTNGEPLQGAAIVIQPQTGYILALSGGRDFITSQFNRVLQGKRQPGSLFKPIVALTAFSQQNPDGTTFTPVTELEDQPLELKLPNGQTWTPQNYDKEFRGTVTLRQALEQSINIPMIRLSTQVGLRKIITMAHRLGIESELAEVNSLALGTSEVTPFELGRAFATIANNGVRPDLLSVRDVMTRDAQVLERRRIEVEEVTSPQAAYMTTQMMVGVVEHGTGRGIKAFGITRPVAGKTGTTSDYKDSWFVGFTPDLVCLVWVGFDDNTSTGLTGSKGALPIWASIMRKVLESRPEQQFVDPPGIIRAQIDSKTKKRMTPRCDHDAVFEEFFIEGTEPPAVCPSKDSDDLAGDSTFQRLKHFFGM